MELDVVLHTLPPDPCVSDPARCKPVAPPRPAKKVYGPVTFALLGVSGAAVVTTVVPGVLALDAKSTIEAECFPARSYCTDPTAGASDYDRMRTLAWASTISLGVAVLAGVVALAWPRHIVAPPSAVALAF